MSTSTSSWEGTPGPLITMDGFGSPNGPDNLVFSPGGPTINMQPYSPYSPPNYPYSPPRSPEGNFLTMDDLKSRSPNGPDNLVFSPGGPSNNVAPYSPVSINNSSPSSFGSINNSSQYSSNSIQPTNLDDDLDSDDEPSYKRTIITTYIQFPYHNYV